MKSAHPDLYDLNRAPKKRRWGGTPGVPMVLNPHPLMDNTFSAELAARLCREYTEECVSSLVEHMRDRSNPTTSLAATNMILDRGYGKAKEVKLLTDSTGDDAPKYAVKIEFVENAPPERRTTVEE